jgi:hypothetical protein
MFNELRSDVIVRFVNIARNADHHCLIFLLITLFKSWLIDWFDVTWKYQVYKITIQRLKRYLGKFKDTNLVIRSRQSKKDRQYKGREKDTKRTKNNLQNSTIIA